MSHLMSTIVKFQTKAAEALVQRREDRGQTAAEYVGIIVVIAAIITAIVGLGLPGIISGALSGAITSITG
jgi:Flp pilus assembly pilin Flp